MGSLRTKLAISWNHHRSNQIHLRWYCLQSEWLISDHTAASNQIIYHTMHLQPRSSIHESTNIWSSVSCSELSICVPAVSGIRTHIGETISSFWGCRWNSRTHESWLQKKLFLDHIFRMIFQDQLPFTVSREYTVQHISLLANNLQPLATF